MRKRSVKSDAYAVIMRGMSKLHKRIACILTSFLAVGVSVAAQAGVPARNSGGEQAGGLSGGSGGDLPSLRVAVSTAPKTLDAATATDAAAARILQLTHPALLRWNKTYQPVGRAAQGCTQSGARVVTCTLPANVHYTNGAAFTAGSVEKWFGQLQANPRSPFGGPLKGVEVRALTSQTLQFTLASPTLTFMATLAEVPLADPASPGAGLGPYVVAEQDTLGNTTLRALQPGVPQRLEFTAVADATTRLLKLKKGEVDAVLNDLPPEMLQWARQQGLAVQSAPGTGYTYLGLNFGNEYLENPAVREAMATAINRPALRKHLLGGLAEPASTLLPPGHPAAWNAPEEAYDVFSAETLLEEAGYLPGPEGPRFALTLLTSTDAFSQRVAQALQAQLGRVGIRIELRPTEWAAFYDAVKKGQFDMVLLAWAGEQQPAFYYQTFNGTQTPPVGFNRGRLNDAGINRLTQGIMEAQTPQGQNALAVQTQQALAVVRPYIPLYRRHNVLVTAPYITGCNLPASGSYIGLLACRKK